MRLKYRRMRLCGRQDEEEDTEAADSDSSSEVSAHAPRILSPHSLAVHVLPQLKEELQNEIVARHGGGDGAGSSVAQGSATSGTPLVRPSPKARMMEELGKPVSAASDLARLGPISRSPPLNPRAVPISPPKAEIIAFDIERVSISSSSSDNPSIQAPPDDSAPGPSSKGKGKGKGKAPFEDKVVSEDTHEDPPLPEGLPRPPSPTRYYTPVMADPTPYILSLQNNIRQRPISWEGAVRAKTISDADLKAVKSIDKVRKEQRKQTIESNPKTYCSLFLGGDGQKSILESARKRQDIIQYMLVLASDVIDDVPDFAKTLIHHPDPYAQLIPLLQQSNSPEDPIALLASTLITKLLHYAIKEKDAPKVSETLPIVYKHLASLSKTSDAGLQDIAVQHYSDLLRTSTSRGIFWDLRSETLVPLFGILKSAGGTAAKDTTFVSSVTPASVGGVSLQLLYHVLLVIWLLSFDGEEFGDGLDDDYDLIPLYVSLLRISPKEKTTRVLLATLVNLLNANPESLVPAAALANLAAALKTLHSRHLTDEDLLEDLTTLSTVMEEHTKSRTTFDEYAAEVRGGHLRWSPPHRSAMFWAENARRVLEENRGELPQKLAEILGKEWESDPQVLAIACNDVACLVKEVPEARGKLDRWGLKRRVMALMMHQDESIKWESLRALGVWMGYQVNPNAGKKSSA